MESVVVEESRRGQGLGRDLMHAVLAQAAVYDAPHVSLTCRPIGWLRSLFIEVWGLQRPQPMCGGGLSPSFHRKAGAGNLLQPCLTGEVWG
ncbi:MULTISPECIES: GNAT family N-acetyltransferase [Agrobacterium tumefaciens complex]|uniref:GNAT family N-acetyltransferase n=1 Tax=Agrobacterium tumefaciens complex TaxID=1183400 RepID=UPI0038506C2C